MIIQWVRSFIAIELPSDLRLELGKLIESLRLRKQTYIKWVSPDSIHLTLKFLGDVDANRIEVILKTMEQAASGISPFSLEVGNTGVFPNLKRPQVAWIGLEGDIAKVNELQLSIDMHLDAIGYPPESRAFTPHLTMARVRDNAYPDERQEFGQLISSTKAGINYRWQVNSFNLMRSQLTPKGAIYNKLGEVFLK